MKKSIAFGLLFMAVACKSKKINTKISIDSSVSTKEIIDKHISLNSLDFQTLHIKGKTSYSIFNINLDIRIQKDEIIWLSAKAPLVGNVARVKITPEEVSYYSNYSKEYFKGDYVFLSDWLGMELDFQKVQNLLLGRTINKWNNRRINVQIENNLYRVSWEENDLFTTYFFEPECFRLSKQHIIQSKNQREASVEYSKYKTQNNTNFPYLLLFYFVQQNKKNLNDTNKFEVEYKTIDFDTEITFPFQIPEGYKEIEY